MFVEFRPAAATIARSSSGSSQGQPPLVPSAQPQSQQAQVQEAQGSGAINHVSAGSAPANLGQSVQPARPRSTGGRGGRGGNTQVVGGRGGPFVYHGVASTGINNGVQKVEPGFAPPIPAVGPGQYLNMWSIFITLLLSTSTNVVVNTHSVNYHYYMHMQLLFYLLHDSVHQI